MNKRGLSQVVTTVLLILVVLVAVSIIAGVILSITRSGTSQVTAECITLQLEVESCIDSGGGSNGANITIKRNAGQANLANVTFLFNGTIHPGFDNIDSGNHPPGELETTVYDFDGVASIGLPDLAGTSVSIAGVLEGGQICSPTQPVLCR